LAISKKGFVREGECEMGNFGGAWGLGNLRESKTIGKPKWLVGIPSEP